ncbi:hypothetical protein ACFXI0_17140 [Kitasatospora indigofera]|uniref:hypothetical protein n=1 Tax=Kitasatospora indigofera TaxID=67307 RepID=UPI003691E500
MTSRSNRSTTPYARIGRRAFAAMLLAITLGACMSAPGTGKDDPLPVKDKKDAQAWAEQMTEHTARSAGLQIDPASIKPLFTGCVGRNGESAPDDRYTLMYSVKSSVPLDQHPEAVRKIRDMAQQEGLTITSYRETADGKPEAFVNAEHPSDYSLTASTSGGQDRMYLSVITPCLLPPASPSPTAS